MFTATRLACTPSCSQSPEKTARQRSKPSQDVPPQRSSRRSLLASIGAASALSIFTDARAAIPPQPPLGDCPDCIGPANDALSACRLGDSSCISTYNDDEDHFQAPWSYDGSSRKAAMDRLIDLATGKAPLPADLVDSPFNRDRGEVAQFILGATASFVLNKPMPAKPGLTMEEDEAPTNIFDGRLDFVDYDAGYIRIVFGESGNGASAVYDGEFLLFANDEVCNVRVGSRNGGGKAYQAFQTPGIFSFTSGISLSRNGARELSEDIRKALRWGVTPVIVGFDPRFNNDRKLWFERPFAALRGDQSAFEADEYDWRRIDLEDLAAEDMPRER